MPARSAGPPQPGGSRDARALRPETLLFPHCGLLPYTEQCGGAEQAQSRLCGAGLAVQSLGAGRPRDLVLRHRVQRPLLHLFVSRSGWAPRSTGSRSSPRKTSATCSRAGASRPIPTAAFPGDPNCPARTLDETYGFQYCKGDDELLKFVGREGYRDPACDFQDAPFNVGTPHGEIDQRQSPCDLLFGTSTGALGPAQVPQSALRCGEMAQAQRLARDMGRVRQVPLGRQERTETRAPTGCSTDRSSRRSASACRAAPATSPTIR